MMTNPEEITLKQGKFLRLHLVSAAYLMVSTLTLLPVDQLGSHIGKSYDLHH